MGEKSKLEYNKTTKTTLNQQAYIKIKEAIIYCEIKPGTWISENGLSESLNMSRTPVREALKMLSNEGFVEIKNGLGVFVKDVSMKDLKDLFKIRENLECMAMETSIKFITEEDIKIHKDIWESILVRIKNKETINNKEISKYDNMLHGLFIEKCGNSYIKSIMRNINQLILRYQMISVMALDDVEDTVKRHLEIIELLEKKDVDNLARLLRKHIHNSASIIKENNIEIFEGF